MGKIRPPLSLRQLGGILYDYSPKNTFLLKV